MARSDRHPRTRLDPDARRASLLEAAAVEFAALPYAEVTIAAIARRADASDALLYRYFAGKEDLYTALVQLSVERLLARQSAALAALPAGVPVRDLLHCTTSAYLDHIATHPNGWATPLRSPGSEPAAAAGLRLQARHDYVQRLRALLSPSTQERHDYALWGYFGFLDAACLHWVERGCPDDDRHSLIDAALGALEGALGDWAA